MVETSQQQDTDAASGTVWINAPVLFGRRRMMVCLVVVAVYMVGVCPMWWPTSDSALYLSLSHSLADGDGFVYNGTKHTLVPPGLPAVLAGLERLFGPGYLAGNIFVALCGLGALAMMYLTLRKFGDDSIAFAVVLITALGYPFYSNSHRILTQIPFALVFWSMFYTCLRMRDGRAWWLLVVALLSLLSIVIRAPGLLLVGPLGVGLFFAGKRSPGGSRLRWCSVAMLGPMFLVAGTMLGVAWFRSGHLPGYLTYAFGVLSGGVGERISTVSQAAWWMPDIVTKWFVGQRGLWPLGVLGIVVIAAGMTHLWKNNLRYIVIFVGLSLVAYLMMGPDMIGTRYFLSLMPLYIFAMLHGLCICVRWISRRRGRSCSQGAYLRAVGIFTLVCIAINSPKVLRNAVYYSYTAWSNPESYYHVTRSDKYDEFFKIASILDKQPDLSLKVGGPHDGERVIHHLSGRIMFSYTTGKQERGEACEADRIIGFIREHPEIRCFVLDVRDRAKPSTNAFFGKLDPWLQYETSAGRLELLHKGKYYSLLRRGTSKTQTSQPRDDPLSLQP
ncbi:MAG: glycosyltransferase family 39 protein [bacterium]|nr:glycosyltransferase family 39 protein [bacterium]